MSSARFAAGRIASGNHVPSRPRILNDIELTPGFNDGSALQDVVDVKRVLQMGVEPVQIHVMSAISGVSWEEAWRDRIVGPCGRHQVAFLGRETILRNKRAAARPKDLADIDALTSGEEDE